MQELTDNSSMPFGAHKGKAMANVPASYLLFLWKQVFRERPDPSSNVSMYINRNLDDLEQEAKKNERRTKT